MTTESLPHVMLVAGEASGDMHAANLVHALREITPKLRYSGMGGDAMRQAGVNLLVDASELAVVGIWEVLAHYRQISQALKTLKYQLRTDPPDLLIVIDYVEFNLRLATEAKRLGIKVLFYVSPQIWAWRSGRIQRIKHAVDAMAVLFPFEARIYKRHGIPVRYVGNPLLDTVKPTLDRTQARARFALDPAASVVGLLPGSRRGELRRHMPIIMASCKHLQQVRRDVRFLLALAPGVNLERDIHPYLDPALEIQLIAHDTHHVMQASDALIIASGTATLEAGLLGIPMAIIYRLSPISYALLKPLVRIRDIGLVNIVSERRIVEEFIQHKACAERISAEIQRLLEDQTYRKTMQQALHELRGYLGQGGTSHLVASMALELMTTGQLHPND